MNQYRYVALGSNGRKITGEVLAPNLEAAENQLAQQNLYPTQIEPANAKASSTKEGAPRSSLFTKRINAPNVDEVSEMLRAMSVMTQSGVTVVEALQAVADNAASPGIQELARNMRNDIMSGRSLSQSMAFYPQAFPEVVVDMVAVADESGKLSETLQSVITYLDRNNTVRKNIISALVYPSILMGASVVAFLILVVVILPTFADAFESLEVKLPWFTTMLLEFGKFIRNNLLVSIGSIVLAVMGWKRLMKVPRVKRAYSLFLLKLPVIGPILNQIALNRSLRTLGSLLRTNVPIIESITYAAKVANCIPLVSAWDNVRIMVGNGGSLAESMAATSAFPKMMIQMVAVGERSGRISELLEVMTEHSEQQAERRIKTAVSLLEPLVIVGMGVMVGMITISILLPLFSINNNIR